jgi:hypothetical protein
MADNKLYSNIYNINEFWLNKIAPKYFNLNDISLQRVGMFGYINEVMSTVTEDVTNATAILVNEIFPMKSNLPEMILNYSNQYQIQDINAVPATIPIVIGIPQKTLIEKSTIVLDTLDFIIDKDSEIIIDDQYTFMIDYDIKITSKYINNNYIHTAQYIMNPKNPISDITIPYLKTYKMMNYGEEYVFITLRARQVSKQVTVESVYSADIIDNYSKIITYDTDQLAGFNIFYKSPKTSDYIQLITLLDGSSYIKEPFCFYLYSDEKELEIKFPNLYNYFSLEFNAELKYELYLTKGVNGNINYTGTNVKFIPKSEIYDYSNIIIACELLGEAKGGRDRLVMDEIKQRTQEESMTKGTITTDIDLNLILDKLANSKVVAIKKRDDIIQRLFEAFILMTDKENNIIPTNTLDLKLLESDFDLNQDGNRIIKAGTMLEFNSNKILVKKDPGTVSDVSTYEKTNFLYSNLFTIIVRQNPFFVSFYLNSINRKVLFDISYINPYSYIQFILNEFNIYRNSLLDSNEANQYKFTLKMTPNTDIPFSVADIDANGNVTSDLNKLKIFIVFKEDEIDLGYIPLTFKNISTTGVFTFEGVITTNDYISLYNKIQISNSIIPMSGTIPEVSTMIPISNLGISVISFINDGESVTNMHPYHTSIDGVSNFKLTNIYNNTDDKVDIVIDMLNYMSSFIKTIKPDISLPDYYYLLKLIPVFRYSYLKDSIYINTILENINGALQLIDKNTSLIENNNSINIKWYNTYGPSKYFTIGANQQLLDKLNIKIAFKIKVNKMLLSDEYKINIQNHIKQFIESINSSTANLYIFDIFNSLKAAFPDIIYVEFIGINDYDSSIQIMENSVTDVRNSLTNIKDFVPEFVNIDTQKNANDIKEPQILITYV